MRIHCRANTDWPTLFTSKEMRRGGIGLSTGPTREREGSGARTCGYTVEQIPVGKYSLRAWKIRRSGIGLSTGPTREREGSGPRTCGYTAHQRNEISRCRATPRLHQTRYSRSRLRFKILHPLLRPFLFTKIISETSWLATSTADCIDIITCFEQERE